MDKKAGCLYCGENRYLCGHNQPRTYTIDCLGRAAKDLYDALKVLVAHAQEKYPHFESERGQQDIKAALKAIAKAEGR